MNGVHFFPRQTSVIDVHIYRSSIYAEYFEYPSIPSRIQTILSSGKSSLAFVREKRGGERGGQTKIDPFPLPFSPSFFDSSIPRFPELALRSRAPTNASSSEPCKAVRGREDRRKKGGGQRHPCNHQRLTHSFHPCFPPCFSSSLRALILLPAHTRCRERERDIWAYTGEGMRENIRKLSTAERPLLLEADNFTWIRGCFERNCTVT